MFARIAMLPLAVVLFGFGECAPPSVVVPLPEYCKRIEGQEIPALPGQPRGTYETDYTVNVAEALQTDTGATSLRAWVSFAQLTATDGDLAFVEALSVSAVTEDGAVTELASFSRTGAALGNIVVMQTSRADLLPLISAAGDVHLRMSFTGQPPAEALHVNFTGCVAGEATYGVEAITGQ